jgi:preprotein translocase subunit SecG
VSPIEIGLLVVVNLMSIALLALILLHKGKGGGLSDMFGGGMSTSLGGSNVVERNLDRMTIAAGIVWFACIGGLGLRLGSN